MAWPVVGEMEMHSVANLATVQTPLVTFSLQKSGQSLFSFGDPLVLSREREILLFQRTERTHLSLSLSLHLLCLAHGREEQGFRLNTDIILLILFYKQVPAEITTQLLSLSYVYMIS